MSKWNPRKEDKQNERKSRFKNKGHKQETRQVKEKKQLNPWKKWKDRKEQKQREIERQKELERIEKQKEEEKRRKLMLVVIGILALFFSIIVWPLSLPASLIPLWYFTKKSPNTKYKKYARYASIISVFGLIMSVVILNTGEPLDGTNEVDAVEQIADVEAEETAEKEREEALQKEQEEKERAETEKKEQEELAEKERLKEEQEEDERQKELTESNLNKTNETEAPKEAIDVPEGQEDVKVNENIPRFSNEDITSTEVYHHNGPLDSQGRVTAANAVVGVEIMPAHERGNQTFEPTGWNQRRYASIGAGGWLYNRSHLIGFQLTGNDDYANLMTGTRWFNMRMLEYENFVANYVETTENHVRYRVTPVFEGNNLVASGAYMEGFSIEDNGEGLMFNVYVPNVQSGVEINYADGSSIGPEGPAQEGEIKQYTPPKSSASDSSSPDNSSGSSGSQSSTPPPVSDPSNPYVDENGNGLIKGSNSRIYHVPGSQYYDSTTNPAQMFKSIEEAIAAGYRAPK